MPASGWTGRLSIPLELRVPAVARPLFPLAIFEPSDGLLGGTRTHGDGTILMANQLPAEDEPFRRT